MRRFCLASALSFLAFPAVSDDAPQRPDLLTFAQGVLPVAIQMPGTDMRTGMEHAIAAIDGNPVKFGATPKPGLATDGVALVYAMPAPTRFDRFAVPGIRETPSPSQTFFKTVELFGAPTIEGPWAYLGGGELTPHDARGQITELGVQPDAPAVSFVALRLSGGVDLQREMTFFEFTEIIANGTQADQALATGFSGIWSGRGVKIELAQDGPTVAGCYDRGSKLSGTVEGPVLRALG